MLKSKESIKNTSNICQFTLQNLFDSDKDMFGCQKFCYSRNPVFIGNIFYSIFRVLNSFQEISDVTFY